MHAVATMDVVCYSALDICIWYMLRRPNNPAYPLLSHDICNTQAQIPLTMQAWAGAWVEADMIPLLGEKHLAGYTCSGSGDFNTCLCQKCVLCACWGTLQSPAPAAQSDSAPAAASCTYQDCQDLSKPSDAS